MIYYQQTNNQLVNLLEKQIIILTYLKFITNKGCGGVVSTPSSLTKRSQVRFPLGTESPWMIYYQQTNNQLVNLLEKQIIILTYLKFITNKGCGGVVSTPSSLTKRSQVRFPLGTESPLLGSALLPNVGLSGMNPDLVGLWCGVSDIGWETKKNKSI